jgi:hypothetical protein
MDNQEQKVKINMDFHAIEYASRLGEDQDKLQARYQSLADDCTIYLLKDDLTVEQSQYAKTIKESCLLKIHFMTISKEEKAKHANMWSRR